MSFTLALTPLGGEESMPRSQKSPWSATQSVTQNHVAISNVSTAPAKRALPAFILLEYCYSRVRGLFVHPFAKLALARFHGFVPQFIWTPRGNPLFALFESVRGTFVY